MSKHQQPSSLQTLVLGDSTEVCFTVRESRRAKNVLLKMRPRLGLEVVVPVGFDRGRLPVLLERKSSWIQRQLQRKSHLPEPAESLPPERLELRALERSIPVRYQASPRLGVALRGDLDGVVLRGEVSRQELCRKALRCWLKSRARAVLPGWLGRVGDRLGLSPGPCTVRLQKTRWGSCSARGSVSLNAKLLFLPARLVEYVLLHELAHLRVPNHSPAYWRMVGTYDPEYKDRESELKQAWRYIPAWVEQE